MKCIVALLVMTGAATAGPAMDARGYLTHEFGDSVLIERAVPGGC